MRKNIKPYWAWGIVAVLALVLIFLCVALVRTYRHNARSEALNAERATFVSLLSHRTPLTTADTSYIQAWMTFDYVNTIYKLPESYLETALTITDPHYPRISLTRYARENKIESNAFLAEVKAAVASSSPEESN